MKDERSTTIGNSNFPPSGMDHSGIRSRRPQKLWEVMWRIWVETDYEYILQKITAQNQRNRKGLLQQNLTSMTPFPVPSGFPSNAAAIVASTVGRCLRGGSNVKVVRRRVAGAFVIKTCCVAGGMENGPAVNVIVTDAPGFSRPEVGWISITSLSQLILKAIGPPDFVLLFLIVSCIEVGLPSANNAERTSTAGSTRSSKLPATTTTIVSNGLNLKKILVLDFPFGLIVS